MLGQSQARFTSFDEFGNPQPMTLGETGNAPPARYGWLGAAQRNADTPTGAILMGVRLYHPATGRFLQTDQIAGGSASAYDYCNADPVNCTDLAGTFSWKGLVKTVAVVGEVASWIPGPVGAAAAGVSAVAYAASGNKGKALEMGVTAAAQLVGAGAGVRAGFKVASVSAKIGAKSQRGGSKIVRAVQRPRCHSFLPGTLVRLADGSFAPIETLQAGDLVLAMDPSSGAVTTESVIYPIEGFGTKHLIEVTFEGVAAGLTATDSHPLWVEGEGWVLAGNLEDGDIVLSSSGARRLVSGISDLGWLRNQHVRNLHVTGPHTYFVATSYASTDLLVHNASCPVANNAQGKKGERMVEAQIRANPRASNVQTQVYYRTPLGKRFVDIQYDIGVRRIIVEVKTGKSRYTRLQRAKDTWIARRYGFERHLIRV